MVSVAPVSFGQSFEGSAATRAERREKVEDATAKTGAAVAGGAAVHKSIWKQFNSSSRVGQLSQEAQAAIRTTREVTDKANTLFGAFRNNVARFRNIAMDFAAGFKSAPIIKNILKSKAYRVAAGGFGYTMAGFVFLSGLMKAGSVYAEKAAALK